MNIHSDLSAVSEYLSIALDGVRQVAFNWDIPSDKLHFNGEPACGLNSVLLDMSRACSAHKLPEIVHDRDRDEFRTCLLQALRACSRSSEQHRQEGQVNELQAGVEPSLAVFP